MIAYRLIITEGDINACHMEVQLGTLRYGICCTALRRLIHKANKTSVYEVIEKIGSEEVDGMFAFLYEEFKDKI